MASSTATTNGFVTDKTLNHYEKLTKSGAGIVFVEYTYVHPTGRGEENQLGIYSNEQIEGLTKLAEVIKKSGALAGIQLVHNGGKSSSDLTQQPLLAPSPVPVPVKDREMEIPKEIPLRDIQKYQSWYIKAVERAIKAGFQIVEFHAAHGYGLNQWLSPITNHRTDAYGGSLENRSRMMAEILSQVREKFPQTLFGFRIPGEDHFPGGLNSADMIWVSRKLESLGADFLDVSSGIGGWRRPAHRNGEGYLVPDAEKIQSQLNIPVIGVGGIQTGPFIDGALKDSLFSFAAVGRAILNCPQGFYCDVLSENPQEKLELKCS
jgi:NADPH2 dehydrogenase